MRMTIPDVEAAHRFLAASGRVLDRRRFERLFLGGEARPVRDAVAAYRNPDGGFGHGLEPDERTPASQPLAVDPYAESRSTGRCLLIDVADGATRAAAIIDSVGPLCAF